MQIHTGYCKLQLNTGHVCDLAHEEVNGRRSAFKSVKTKFVLKRLIDVNISTESVPQTVCDFTVSPGCNKAALFSLWRARFWPTTSRSIRNILNCLSMALASYRKPTLSVKLSVSPTLRPFKQKRINFPECVNRTWNSWQTAKACDSIYKRKDEEEGEKNPSR